jgi:PAS domain S-box-containing protein
MQRVKDRDALKQTEENLIRLAAIVESSDDAIIGEDLNSIITSWNKGAEKIFGYSADEMVGGTIKQLIPADRQDEQDKFQAQIRLGGSVAQFETVRQAKDGCLLNVSITLSPIKDAGGKVIGMSKVARDITEHKRAEAALRDEQAMFQSLADTIPDRIYFKDLQSRFVRINEAMTRRFNLKSAAEAVGKTDCDFRSKEHADRAYKDEQHIMSTGEPLIDCEEMETRPDGHVTWSSATKVPLRDARGNITGLVGITRDITERKRIEARFRRLVDSNAQGVIFFNMAGEITGSNDAFLHLTGYTGEDLEAGRVNWTAMTPPEYAHLDRHALEQIAAGGSCVPYEKEFIRKQGSRVPVLLGAAAFEDNPGEGVCFVLDLTERKKLETEFRQSQKMEAIGQLAGGVAHDFNNILAVIQGYADLLKTDSDLSTAQSDYTAQIGAASQRAAALTRQLLLFSRKETMQARDMDLNQSINDVTKLLRRTLGEEIQLQFKFAMESLFIRADPGMMDQVLINLAVNSRDAMPGGGQLAIETSAVEFDKSILGQSDQCRPGSFACLTISDTGCGIAPEILSKIFEPFFTTKDVGKGTGLGLATVFGIIQQHQGWINVSSEVGRGTTFRIYLPRLEKLSEQKPQQPESTSLVGGDETILLVEDDAFLCASVRKTLSQLGYRVLEAVNGAEAIEIWKQNRDEIDLLLTDLVMPGGINGKELGEWLLKENPQLKVIYASGYSAEIAGKDFSLEEGVNFLTKPFESHKLAQIVRNRLDAKSQMG